MSANRLVRARVPTLRATTLAAQLGRSLSLGPDDDINLAIAALAPTADEPAVVWLAPGAYVSDAINMLPGLTIAGAGADQSTVLAPVTFPAAAVGTAAENTMVLKNLAISYNGVALTVVTGVAGRRMLLDNVTVLGTSSSSNATIILNNLDELELSGAVEFVSGSTGDRAAIVEFGSSGTGTLRSLGSLRLAHSGAAGQADAVGLVFGLEGPPVFINSLVLDGCSMLFLLSGGGSQVLISQLVVDSGTMAVPPVVLYGAADYHIQLPDSTFVRDENYVDALDNSAISSLNALGTATNPLPANTVLSLGRMKWVLPGGSAAALYGQASNLIVDPMLQ